MCLTGNRKEWLRVSAPGPRPVARLLYRYGVCGAGVGGAAGETGFLGLTLLISGPEALWQVG